MACVPNPDIIRHQMRTLIGTERAQRKGWFQEHAAWISDE
jgi:hypothetical protein